jgi:hypothetical protein
VGSGGGGGGVAGGDARVREQPDFSSHPRPRPPRARDVGLLLVGALALGLAARSAWVARRGVGAARERVAEAQQVLDSLASRIGPARDRSGAEAALVARAAGAAEAPPERIVAGLARVLPEDVRLERLTIDYGDTITLNMQVVARAPASWDLLLARLAESGSFENVIPGPERRPGEVRTSIAARWARRAP